MAMCWVNEGMWETRRDRAPGWCNQVVKGKSPDAEQHAQHPLQACMHNGCQVLKSGQELPRNGEQLIIKQVSALATSDLGRLLRAASSQMALGRVNGWDGFPCQGSWLVGPELTAITHHLPVPWEGVSRWGFCQGPKQAGSRSRGALGGRSLPRQATTYLRDR